MYKHHYKPYSYSYFNGEETIMSYKCECCNQIIHYRNITKMDKKSASCTSFKSSSTLVEYINGIYDCSVYNESLRYKISRFTTFLYNLYLTHLR